ncbi:N-acetylmuramoyl-L-alanine amidase [Butyrivibrio sp. WCD2001]|uniref:N-acetylmuramoyl-L-alanine amidase n=1 Tax=Butyrivibrio sp. WCD2001 TaxID=1280681 RepID=UPI00047DCF2B|nr:N-acetylmuramoyl-L-alanine amidase [Butyrivibrio sp. WCD2001]
MIENRLRKTAIMTGIFVVLSLGVMFFRAATKDVIIAEAGEEVVTKIEDAREYELKIQAPTTSKGNGSLVIPLESGVSSDSITFEERHGLHQFVLYVKGKDPEFYAKNGVVTDLICIQKATFSPLGDSGLVCLKFWLDGLYENSTSLGDGEIVVNFNAPSGDYENVVVIDPVDELGLKMIPYIKNAFQGDESVKLYFTTLDDTEVGAEALASLINDSGADFYVQLGIDETVESDAGVRTYFNDRFFIRGFGNVELADKLEMSVAENSGNKALGLSSSYKENEKLTTSKIPSAFVTIGNLNNRVDHDKLSKDSYIEKCAKGVAEGIRNAFEAVNPTDSSSEDDALQGIING